MTPSKDIARLVEIMAALRTPVTGCPWDLQQNFATIAPYTLEEAYEVADAIERADLADLRDELGDLLLQVVYHSRMAEEQGAFDFGDVVEGVTRKMIRRHPHVFGDEPAGNADAVDGLWARIKAEEKIERAAARARLSPDRAAEEPAPPSLLADIPPALPALTRALKLQDKAAKVGFDWPNLGPVFDKLKEELAEFEDVALPQDPRGSRVAASDSASKPAPSGRHTLDAASDSPSSSPPDAEDQPAPSGRLAERESEGANQNAAIKEEFGDLLFVMANIARHLKIDPESALRGANAKFMRRFAYIEEQLDANGSSPAQSTLSEMDRLWDEAKAREKR